MDSSLSTPCYVSLCEDWRNEDNNNHFDFIDGLLPGLMISNVSSLPSVVGVNTPLPTLYVLVRLDIFCEFI